MRFYLKPSTVFFRRSKFTIEREQPLADQGVVNDSPRDYCVMDFSQSVMPTLLALAVIGTLLLVAFQAAA